MNKKQSEIIIDIIEMIQLALDEYLKRISAIEKPKSQTLVLGIILERIYLQLFGLLSLQKNIIESPQIKSSIFLILRAIISDMMTGLIFDHFRNDEKIFNKINDLHTKDFIQYNEFLNNEETQFFIKTPPEKMRRLQIEYLEEIQNSFEKFYRFENGKKKLKSNKEIIDESISDWPFLKNYNSKNKSNENKQLKLTDKAKYEFLKNIEETSPIHGLKIHYIYLVLRIASQHQHYSENSIIQFFEFDDQYMALYRRTISYLLLTIEQIATNITEVNEKDQNTLRKFIHAQLPKLHEL